MGMSSGYAGRCIGLIALIAGCMGHMACRQSQVQHDHTAKVDTLLMHADEAADSRAASLYLDAGFRSLPHPSPLDYYRKYYYQAMHASSDDTARLAYCDSAEQAIAGGGDRYRKYLAELFILRGEFLLISHNYRQASLYYNRARHIAEVLNDSCLLAHCMAVDFETSAAQGKYMEAARYGRQIIDRVLHCSIDYHSYTRIANYCNNTGIFYNKVNLPDSALSCYSLGLQFLDQYRTQFAGSKAGQQFSRSCAGVIYGNMGSVYLAKGDTPAAVRYFYKSLALTDVKGVHPGDAQYTWLKLARVYLAQGRYREFTETAGRLAASLESEPDGRKKLGLYRLELERATRSKNAPAVFRMVPPYFSLKDSLDNVATAELLFDTKRNYEQYKQEQELIVLQHEQETDRLLKIIALVFCTAIAIVSFVLWYNWRRSGKLLQQVREKNGQLSSTLSALETSQQNNMHIMQVVAHDLRNPIAAIASITAVLHDDRSRPERDLSLFQMILSACEGSLRLTDELIRDQYNTASGDDEQIALDELLCFCIDQFQARANEKQLDIRTRIIPATIRGNTDHLLRVFSNLLVNAIKFSHRKGKIILQLSTDDGNAIVSIRDYGIGMPESVQQELFRAPAGAGRDGTQGEQSFGMGLAISRQMVEAHGGSIWFRSQEHRGTTFYVRFPLAKDGPSA